MTGRYVRASSLGSAATAVLLLSATNAHAYLDPGSGSLIIQALIAGFLGASFYIATSWKKIKAYFQNRRDKKDAG
jgi:hypothetical protein